MNVKISHSPKRISYLIDGLTLFTSLKQKDIIRLLLELCERLAEPSADPQEIFRSYHRFASAAIKIDISDYILDYILTDVNLFSELASKNGLDGIEPGLLELAEHDLNILQEITFISSEKFMQEATKIMGDNWMSISNLELPDPINPNNWPRWERVTKPSGELNSSKSSMQIEEASGATTWLTSSKNAVKQAIRRSTRWGDAVDKLVIFYSNVGCGIFANTVAFRWKVGTDGGGLDTVANLDLMTLKQFVGLKRELNIILENTEHFLNGFRANNMILYGNRGTGKSSIIKALLHEFVGRGLRLIEMPKEHLADLQKLLGLLAEIPKKIIIYIDDLSFSEDEADYKSLKSMLEGSLEVKPTNVLVYATSNRRHLITEHFADRQGEEIHARDGMEERLSLADRFGITVTFTTPDQEQYLQIVEGIIKQHNFSIDPSELRRLALQWEMHYNGRSGRTARQFADYLIARQSTYQDD